MRKILLFLFLLLFSSVSTAKDVALDASYIYDQILDASNYDLVNYNYPAGSRELNLFGLRSEKQYNINAVASPDFSNLVYSEVYFYPDPRVTASALYIIPLDAGLSKKDAILSVSTKDKLSKPIIETNYAQLYPYKFNTYTPVDWNESSDRILFKEKLGENYDQIYLTKIFVYDLTNEKLYDLNFLRAEIINYWTQFGVFLSDYKWDIKPLGFSKKENKVLVKAYGYYKNERKFLGLWQIDYDGSNPLLLSEDEQDNVEIQSNGKCLQFIPDIADVFKEQRRRDAKRKSTYIEPK